MTFDATITEISDYPVSGNSWGDGNPNVSYYEYTAYIEDSSALRNGEAVDHVHIDQSVRWRRHFYRKSVCEVGGWKVVLYDCR